MSVHTQKCMSIMMQYTSLSLLHVPPSLSATHPFSDNFDILGGISVC